MVVKDIWGRTYTFYCVNLNNEKLSSSKNDVQHYVHFAEEIIQNYTRFQNM